MHDNFLAELGRAAAVIAAALLVGSMAGVWEYWLIGALVGLLFWHLRQLYILEFGLKTNAPQELQRLGGVWGEVGQFVAHSRSQDRKRKKRLSRILHRFHQALEAMPYGAIVLDRNAGVEWSNTAAERLIKVSRRDKRALKDITRVVPNEAFRRFIRDKGFAEPLEITSPVDSSVKLLVSATAFGKGQTLLTVHDVTESLRLQAARRDFIANVSHELRTPLTVIRGYMELLLGEELEDPVRDALEQSARQAERMQSIVSDLLMLSRLEMEGDAPEGDHRPLCIPDILVGLLADARRLSGDGQHRFRPVIDQGLGMLGAENEIASAFGNLLFNAVIHTPPGTAIDLFWGREGGRLRFVLHDHGPGIPPEHLQRLTERFYRVDKGRSRDSGGTGLGLSIVKHVIKRHGGTITIDSRVGEGTRFVCEFSADRARAAEQAAAPAAT